MMKVTITLLAALAAADAAEARGHRQARRQYGNGYGYGNGGYGYSAQPQHPSSVETPPPVAYSTPLATPAASSVKSFPQIPYNPVSSKPPVENQSTMGYPSVSSEAPKASSKPTVEQPTGGYAVPSSKPVEASSKPVVVASSKPYEQPTGGYAMPSSKPVEASSKPAGYPVGGSSKPVEASSKPVVVASSKPYVTGVFPSSGAAYPTGTGSPYKSSTPISDMVTKTIYSSGKPIGTTVCAESEYPTTPVKVTTTTPVSELTKTLTQTLVYTVGTGSSARAMTTAVTTTSTQTIYSTVVITVTKPESKPTGSSYQTGSGDEGTTTIKSTTTTTKYVTVHASKPGNGSGASQPAGTVTGASYPTGPAGPGPAGPAGPSGPVVPAGSQCAAPVTVTVTAKETVTVTKGSDTTKPSEVPGGYPVQPSKSASGAETTAKYSSKKPAATPSAGKYPTGNGTYPAGPTGFKTTGVTKPTSIPSFSYVSQPYSAEAPKSSPMSSAPAPAKSTPAGYGSVPMSSAPAPAKSTPAGYGSGAESSAPAPAKSTPAGYNAAPPAPSKGYGY